jgi:3-hydroxy-9,10-secoandrosta-1,3,5(10)-triene-9,17-dione monooxygenase
MAMSTTSPAQQQSSPIPLPEPDLTVDELIERAGALRPLLRERQAECEASGELSEDTNQKFIAAGFYRILQPRLFGGYEFALPDFIRVMMAVARGCSESAWVLALTSGHTVLAAQLSESAQREAFGAAGDFRAPGVGMPTGVGVPSDGGYRVKGAWDYASGCDLATHFFGSTMVHDLETKAPLGNAWILFDRDQFKIVDNWNVIGMQGTGSRRVVIEDAFVSADRALWFLDGQGRPIRDQPGHALHPNPMYHGWLAPLLISEVAAVSVGAARGALDIYGEILSNKKTNFPPFHFRSHEAEFQQHFGEAQALIDTAEAALLKLTADYMDLARQHVASGTPLDEEMERRLILMEQHVIRLVWDAVELMFRTSGTSAASKSSPLGRALRNLAVIRTHVTLQLDHTAANAGRLHFGLPPLSRF